MKPFTIHSILALGAACLTFACQTTIPARPLTRANAGLTFDNQGDYKIGRGDELMLKVHGDESLTSTMVVQENGQITIPLGGQITVAGTTIKEIKQKIESQLSSYMVKPRVMVSVGQKKSYKAYFAGEVLRVGPVQLEEKTTLLKGLALAGGLTPYASERIIIIRKDPTGKTERYFVLYQDLLKGNDSLDSFILERGDTVLAE